MQRCRDYGYKADEGNIFVLTELGKAECASWRHKEVGKPVDEDERYSPSWGVEKGYVEEVPDPEWVEMPGYKAVYDVHGDGKYIFCCRNPHVYHDKEMAELEVKDFLSDPYNRDKKAWVEDAIYKGKRPKPCREFYGHIVYNMDYWTYDRKPGCLVEEEIAMAAADCVPPRTFGCGIIQCGEPYSHKIDENGKAKPTYATFVKEAEGIWKWCGNCFAGEDEPRGTEAPYV